MSIVWRESMKVGDDRLNADHRKFIALLNLTERGLQQKDVAPATDIFEELQAYIESHFPAEEAYMERIGYPERETHRKQHETLAYRFYVLQGRFRAANNDTERRRHVLKLAEFLREWLIEHMLREVIELKPYAQAEPMVRSLMTSPWLVAAPQALAAETPPAVPLAANLTAPVNANIVPMATPASTAGMAGGEWRSLGAVPAHLQKFLAPLDYVIPRPAPPVSDFPSFRALCEAAVWRSVNKLLIFFQRHNENIVRELPPLFIASPEFARNLRRTIETYIFPAMWETRRMRMLLTNFDRAMADDDTFFARLGDRNTDHILAVWSQCWNALRLIEGPRDSGFNIVKIKEDTKRIRDMLQPSTPLAYDLPKVGNREIEIFKALLDPINDWNLQLARRWKPLNDYYIQEKTALGDPDIREGTLRDHLIEIFNGLPEPWGDFILLTAHRVYPRLDSLFLETFTTNFGRTEVAREAVMPYTMRYLRQVRAEPEIRERELREEEEWLNGLTELRKYRNWRSFGGYM